MPNLFGQLVDGTDVEAAVIETIQTWAPTYLAEAARQNGYEPGSIPVPRSYTTTNDFEKFPEDQTPTILVISPGMAERPVKAGDGTYYGLFRVGLAAIVSARDMAATNKLAKVYTAAMRMLLIQRQSLGGFAGSIDWVDERYDDVPDEDGRSIAAGQLLLNVGVENVVTLHGGPPEPEPVEDPTEDPGNWSEVEEVINEVELEGVTDGP